MALITETGVVVCVDPHALVADRVITSPPDFDARYCTANDPLFEPDDGEMLLPSDDVSDQALALATETDSVPLDPCCNEAGPVSEADAGGSMLRTVTASLPDPHPLAARPEYRMAVVEPMVVAPEDGNAVPRPLITTDADGSDACHDSVTGLPGQALFAESASVSAGVVQVVCPEPTGVTARRRLASGGAGGINGEKLIDVTG